jgi:hypothetical protein
LAGRQTGGINKDPPVWLYGARPPPKYVSKNNISSMNSKIQPNMSKIVIPKEINEDRTG